MAKKDYSKLIRNLGLSAFIIAPICGWLYVRAKMVSMEKGIYDDLRRIDSKGKTLADVPRK